MKKWNVNPYVLVMVLVALLGVAVSGLLFLLIPGPDEIMRQMQRRMSMAKSFASEMEVAYHGAQDTTVTASSLRDMHDPGTIKTSEQFSVTFGTVRVAGEHIGIGRSDFFKFSELPEGAGALHFDALTDKWLRVDMVEAFADTALPLLGSGRRPLDADDREALAADFRATPFLAVKKVLKSEKIAGIDTHHYLVQPELLFVRDWYALMEAKRLGRELTTKERASIETFFANTTASEGEVWIAKRDKTLRRIRLRFTHDTAAPKSAHGTLDLSADFSRIDEQMQISAPTGTVENATPILRSLLSGFRSFLPLANDGTGQRGGAATSGSGLPVSSGQIGEDDPDHDGLSNALELFYGTDKANADTDADGLDDGQEVGQGRNPSGPGLLFDFTGGRF